MSSQRYIQIHDEEFCVGCMSERLVLSTDTIEHEDGTYTRNKVVRCQYYSICKELYDRIN